MARRSVHALLALLSVGFPLCGGCASFNLSQPPLWTKSRTADANTLAAHQARLMVDAGESAERQDNIDEAIRLYEQAQSLQPTSLQLDRRLAVLYDQRGEDVRAQAAYEKAVAQTPNDPDLLNDIGVYHLHRSRGAEAETWFRRALALQPAHARYMNNLGISLAMQDRLEESLATFSTLGGPAAAHNNLAVVLMRQGQTENARVHLQRALQYDSSLNSAASLLAHLDRPPLPSVAPDQNGPVQQASYESPARSFDIDAGSNQR